MRAVFITGTDTDVGKTFISALLTKAWDANYWKPIQTGLESCQGDTETVQKLTNLSEDRFERPQIELNIPLSPWRAAIKENKPQTKVNEIAIPAKFLNSSRPLIIEGAGGLYVPINETEITTDLILHFDIPVILVARSGLGTINHTLLSLEHLKNRGIHKVYVVMNGPINTDNAEAIKRFSKGIKIIANIPHSKSNEIESLFSYVPSLDSIEK
ncbi:dethiobiotin synthase [Candida albicans SC5314]|nr:dethiobiotin synthase [Candida albicans SC5314]KHC79593.1 dethiobiotin synthase [Candida albicans SC5314]